MADEPTPGQGAAPAPGQAESPAPAPSGQPPAGAAPSGAPPSTAPAPGNPGQPPAGAQDQGIEITVDGKTEKVTLDEARKLIMQGRDYTRKTQDLAGQRRAFNELVERQVQARLKQQQGNQGQEEEEVDPGQQALTQVTQFRQELADQKLEAELEKVKVKYPHIDEDVLLVHAQRNGLDKFSDLMGIAEQLNESQESDRTKYLESILSDEKHPVVSKTKQKWIDDYLAKKAEEGKIRPITGSGGAPGGLQPPSKPKSLDEADKIALATLKGNL